MLHENYPYYYTTTHTTTLLLLATATTTTTTTHVFHTIDNSQHVTTKMIKRNQ